jgi:predicted membrane channel-forming protein YqfA (hemolysin III family)
MLPKPKTTLLLLSIVALLLLIPFVAMQFTKEVNWSLMDFVMAGILLFGTSLVFELVIRKVKSTKHRLLISGIILLLLFLLWTELAVGIFGSPIAGN